MLNVNDFDFSMFYDYIRDCENVEPDESRVLSMWAANKQFLYEMLDNNLIIKKHVEVDLTKSELLNRATLFRDKRVHSSLVTKIMTRVHEETHKKETPADDKTLDSLSVLYDTLTAEILVGKTSQKAMSFHFPRLDCSLYFPAGQKITRIISKLCYALNIPNADYENWRIAYSLVFQDTKIHGNLCLSIHPMDFATCSDNEEGWDSCLSWKNDGSYRLGSVEMMNSPTALIAYLESDKNELSLRHGKSWNSKVWRAFVLADDRVVSVGRNYQHENPELSKIVAAWVTELMAKKKGCNFSSPNYTNLDSIVEETFGSEYQPKRIVFRSSAMYNDYIRDRKFAISLNLDKKNDFTTELQRRVEIGCVANNITCMRCGSSEKNACFSFNETLCCNDCGHHQVCCVCDCVIEGEGAWDENSMLYCQRCAEEELFFCDYCEVYHHFSDKHLGSFSFYVPQSRQYRYMEKPIIGINVCRCINYNEDADDEEEMGPVFLTSASPLISFDKKYVNWSSLKNEHMYLNPLRIEDEDAIALLRSSYSREAAYEIWSYTKTLLFDYFNLYQYLKDDDDDE